MKTPKQNWELSEATKTVSVAICVITYQRPESLRRLLDGLNHLTFNRFNPPHLKVIVVDNDSTGSASQVCESMIPSFKYPLTYSIEPCRGISYARNRAIACVPLDADFVAFIDDDEVPEASWLNELLTTQYEYNADVVSGVVLPYFPSETVATWIVKGRFFERSRYPTGYLRKTAATNNVLVRGEIFRIMDKHFDERFALTGGEDGHLFRRIYRAGYKIVWSDRALVYEWIPKSRTNIKWLLQRTYRTYSTFSLHEQEFDGSLQTQCIGVIKASGRIILGVLLILPSLVLGKHVFVKALLNISGGSGRFAGLVGKTYQEYKSTIHGY